MSEHTDPAAEAARSFDGVSDAYARARPTYPREAAAWLTGGTTETVLELGAGTGKLTEQLAGLGHRVIASDPSAQMLGHLAGTLPAVPTMQASAERIPLSSGSVGVVVTAQAYHWFDKDRALPEIARVLGRGGAFAAVWNLRDERIPWVRRLGKLIGTQEQNSNPTADLDASGLFQPVQSATFRFWQPLDQQGLRELVTSRSNVAMMARTEREQVLRGVDALYDEYGRGADGMLLPYRTYCYRAVVRDEASGGSKTYDEGTRTTPDTPVGPDRLETDELLIDFR